MKKSWKISVIGAGAVGATLSQRILDSGIADVVMVDILKNVACGKALDMLDAAPITKSERIITGTDDYKDIESSDIVVITAGFPRKPGMTREELISKNAGIVKDAAKNIKNYAPGAVVIVVTNPLDTMTYAAYKTTGFKKEKVFGMAGVLDGARLTCLLAEELKVRRSDIETFILGSHGDTMVPVLSKTRVKGKSVLSLIPKNRLEEIVKRARDRGAEIVGLLGSGSAYYSPSAAAFKMVYAIVNDTKEVLAVSAYLNGEYSLRDLYIGVPCKIGKNGISEIVEFKLSQEEDIAFRESAKVIRSSIETL